MSFLDLILCLQLCSLLSIIAFLTQKFFWNQNREISSRIGSIFTCSPPQWCLERNEPIFSTATLSPVPHIDPLHLQPFDCPGRYCQSYGAKLYQIQRDMHSLAQGDSDVSTYFNRAKKLWDEMFSLNASTRCTCKASALNTKFQQDVVVIQFLLGLNENYNDFVEREILMMLPLPSLEYVYSRLMQEEQKQLRFNTQFLTKNASFSVGNFKQGIPNGRFDARKSQLFCEHCKKKGHSIDKCCKLHGSSYSSSKHTEGKSQRVVNNAVADTEIQHEGQELSQVTSTQQQFKRPLFLENNDQISSAHIPEPFFEEAIAISRATYGLYT